jgi:2Fe-2S ferredoxin
VPKVSYPSRGLMGPCPEGETILEAVRALGYIMDHACGGNALCGTCCVKVLEGEASLSPIETDEKERLTELDLRRPHRLACQAKIYGDIVVLPGC